MASPQPVPTRETAPFWDGLRAHELRLPWCPTCERYMELRAFLCARCLARTEWRAVSGRVTLDSWTVVHRPFTPGFAPPYGVASVIPAEAPRVRLDTMLDPDDLGHVDGGMSGHLAFVDQPAGWTLHRFSPENEGGQTPSARLIKTPGRPNAD